MKVAIIGNGISGITTARHIRKLSNHDITVISSESEHFFSRTALMYVYMGHMGFEQIKPYEDYFWSKNNINLIQDHVDRIDFQSKSLIMKSGNTFQYDVLVLALGSKSNYFGWTGQDLNGVGGLYHLQDLQKMEEYSKGLNRAVVVGGGLIGIEMAEMFNSRKIPVTMLVREESYWDNILPPGESAMVTRHIRAHHIDLRLGTNLGSINGAESAESITIKETNETIPCRYVGLTAGVSPNIGWLKGTALEVDRGILVDEHLMTNVAGVYAVGDCVQLRNPVAGRRPIEAVWYTGRMMGETVAHNICGSTVSYNPGIWFNSAKFLDIEYQVYGDIPALLPDHLSTIYWEHPSENKSIRINFDTQSKVVTGFNLMGIRFRHEVCEKWLNEKTAVSEVLSHISLAYFDPEFYKGYTNELLTVASQQLGVKIQAKNQSKWNEVFQFLKGKK